MATTAAGCVSQQPSTRPHAPSRNAADRHYTAPLIKPIGTVTTLLAPVFKRASIFLGGRGFAVKMPDSSFRDDTDHWFREREFYRYVRRLW
jgi:hypothetical protein